MPSLKEYRDRIASVKSTRKITSAMKMVAASKLRRAQSKAEASHPYSTRMSEMLKHLISNIDISEDAPVLMTGTGKSEVHLLVVVTSDRGLCAGFNSSVVRMANLKIRNLLSEGKKVKIICIGRKGHDVIRREFADNIIQFYNHLGHKGVEFSDALEVSENILTRLENEEFDVCSVLYNRFISVINQEPTTQQLIPFEKDNENQEDNEDKSGSLYIFEPSEGVILEDLLPRNFSVQIYKALLDSAAGEQAARMTAMDNATNNAGDMIDGLTLSYNRARQAYITKELIEIISGAEAV